MCPEYVGLEYIAAAVDGAARDSYGAWTAECQEDGEVPVPLRAYGCARGLVGIPASGETDECPWVDVLVILLSIPVNRLWP